MTASSPVQTVFLLFKALHGVGLRPWPGGVACLTAWNVRTAESLLRLMRAPRAYNLESASEFDNCCSTKRLSLVKPDCLQTATVYVAAEAVAWDGLSV